jgi:broad specificity phosphatase PhoE/CRP-like cAMP-binding protein
MDPSNKPICPSLDIMPSQLHNMDPANKPIFPLLDKHKVARTKGDDTVKMLSSAIKSGRVCAQFQDAEPHMIESLVDKMEYFEFISGEPVVKQGDAGTHFFVTDHGSLDIVVDAVAVSTMVGSGQPFGELALLFNCPRKASVVATEPTGVWGVESRTFLQALQCVVMRRLQPEKPEKPPLQPSPSTDCISDECPADSPKRKISETSEWSSTPKRRAVADPKQKDVPFDGWPEQQKAFCFVRHAEALHNVCNDNLWTPDNPLTKHGQRQCKQAREIWGKKMFDDAELIVVSPMTRTLQTAMLINGGASDARWLLNPMCAESLSGATCDEGTPKSLQAESLPWIKSIAGFGELDEHWWLEKREEEPVRVAAFLDFLRKRPEERIVVVSHGHFSEEATGEYLQNAQPFLMTLEFCNSMKQKLLKPKFNFNNALIKEYELKPLKAIVNAPLTCLKGIGRKKGALIAQVGPKTVRALASWKYANWAEGLCILESSEEAGARDFSSTAHQMNINKALVAEWEGKSASQLLDAPLHAFAGLTQSQDAIFKIIGITKIRDLGSWKYYKWARAVCALANAETADGSS